MADDAPAGWYPLPDGGERYWDGTRWAEQVMPAPLEAAEPMVPEADAVAADALEASDDDDDEDGPSVSGTVDAHSVGAPRRRKRKTLIVAGVAFVVCVGIAALSARGDDGALAYVPSPTPSVTEASPTPSASATETFAVPDLAGMDLREAQDALAALGATAPTESDASGHARNQLIGSAWVVCSQLPAPGTVVEVTAAVELTAVKDGETCPGAEPAVTAEPSPSSTPSPSETATKPEPDPEPTSKAPEPKPTTKGLTGDKAKAVAMARDFLEQGPYSRSALIAQVKGEGFSTSHATFAADYLHVNWTKQAALKAADYLPIDPYSRSGLIAELKGDGFTSSQATAAVDGLGVNWNSQADLKAHQYMDDHTYSRAALIDALEDDGFTSAQAAHGANSVGL